MGAFKGALRWAWALTRFWPVAVLVTIAGLFFAADFIISAVGTILHYEDAPTGVLMSIVIIASVLLAYEACLPLIGRFGKELPHAKRFPEWAGDRIMAMIQPHRKRGA